MADENTQDTTADQTEEKFPNVVTITDAGPCKKTVSVEVPQEKIAELLNEKVDELRKEAVLPGFRKGRAPVRLIEKRFGTDIRNQVKLQLMADGSEAALKDNELDSLRDPDIDHETVELPEDGPMTFEFTVEVRPDFDLPELEGIEVKKPKVEVTDEKVDEEVAAMRERAGIWVPQEDAGVEEGDQVVADVVLVIEGQEEHDKHDNTEFFARKSGFVAGIPVDGLSELLAGAKHGDEKTTSVELPATFFKEELRGKKVDITIDVKEVKKLELAEINDDFLKRFGAEDEEDLKDRIREYMTDQAERQARAAMSDQVRKYLSDQADFDLPADIVAEQSTSILQRQYSNMLMQGMAKEQLDERMEELRAGSEDQAKEQMKSYFVMDKLAQKFEIEVSEEEINGYIAQVAMYRNRRPEHMREELIRDGSLVQFTMQVREEKCIEKLLESATITDVDPEELESTEEK